MIQPNCTIDAFTWEKYTDAEKQFFNLCDAKTHDVLNTKSFIAGIKKYFGYVEVVKFVEFGVVRCNGHLFRYSLETESWHSIINEDSETSELSDRCKNLLTHILHILESSGVKVDAVDMDAVQINAADRPFRDLKVAEYYNPLDAVQIDAANRPFRDLKVTE